MQSNASSSNNPVLLDTKQTADVHNSMKKRRIEIFFRNRYISIGNNMNMKNKINKFVNKQQSRLSSIHKANVPTVGPTLASASSSINLLN